jgi:hypothetical protein
VNANRVKIKQALEILVEAQRHRDFQRIAVHLAKRRWPELQATEEQNDGGEDATSFVAGTDGIRRSVAASLTGTLAKIKEDAARIKGRGVELGALVFITPIAINNLTVADWAEAISKEFGHPLHVIQQAEIITLLEQPENRWLCNEYLGLNLEVELPTAQLLAATRKVSGQVIHGWKTVNRYEDAKTIELTLIEESTGASGKSKNEARRLTIENLCQIATQRRSATLYGEPGAGKTFTLIQLADALLQKPTAPIPFLVPLPVWAGSEKSLLEFIETQFTGSEVKSGDLAKLFALGQVALLLNGWNEVPDASVERIGSELKVLALHNPALPIFISTRNTRTSLPLPIQSDIFVAPLSSEQKMVMVKKSGHDNPAAFETELETNNALSAITNTPLFLSAAISISRSGEKLLQTRYGLLAQVIEYFERGSEHSTALKGSPCNSFHRRYLELIALKMTQAGGTTLTFDEAVAVVAQCSGLLRAENHFEIVPISGEVLECLVKHHLLVLPLGSNPSYRFVHQQFQEWFAAESLHRTVVAIGTTEKKEELFAFQRDFLNYIQWQEPLSFLMERLANGSEADVSLAAMVIRWAMPVNLSLAAELVGVAGEKVWALVRLELGQALRKWHENTGSDSRGAALAAMLATGAPDFKETIWPLIESPNQNNRLFTYRAWRAFPLSCLGAKWRERFFKWDAERKIELIHEFSWKPDREHIALAAEMLKMSEPPRVRLACFELLLNVGAFELVLAHSENTAVNEWPDGFSERILSRLPRRSVPRILANAKAALPAIESLSARHAIIMTLKRADDSDWAVLTKSEIERLLKNSTLEFRPLHDYQNPSRQVIKPNGSPYLMELLAALEEKEPDWVATFVADMLTQGRLWWKPFTQYIRKMKKFDVERVAVAAVHVEVEPSVTRQRVMELAPCGPLICANVLLKTYLAYDTERADKPRPTPIDRGSALLDGIRELPINSLVDAVLDEARENSTFDSARRLIHLISQTPVAQASKDRKAALRSFVLQVEEQTPKDLKDREWLRVELVDILGCVGTPKDADCVEKWLLDDVQRLSNQSSRQEAEMQAWQAGGRKGRPPVRVAHVQSWNNYQRALVQLGGKEAGEVFGGLLKMPVLLNLAAFGLYLLTLETNEKTDARFGDRPDYAGVWERQQEHRRDGFRSEVAEKYADAIFGAIENFLPELEKEGSRFPKHELLNAIAALAALNDPRAIPLLSRFASDKYSAWTVINALHNLMLKGTVLPGDAMTAILEPFIAEQEAPQWGSNNDNWYMVVRALAILLFSDKPSLGIERILKLPEYRLKNYYIRELLVLLGASQLPEAVAMIVELALKPEINGDYLYEVATVLSNSRNPAAESGLVTLLDKFCTGQLNSNDAHSHLSRALARAAHADGTLWEEIKRRCAKPQSPRERHVLLHILGEAEGLETAACLCDLMNDEFPMGYPAEYLIEEAVTQKIPAGGSSYYVKPRKASDLKKRLLNIAYADVKRRASATQLLGIIGRSRLEHGWPANEPLHPDIELVKKLDGPWELL